MLKKSIGNDEFKNIHYGRQSDGVSVFLAARRFVDKQ